VFVVRALDQNAVAVVAGDDVLLGGRRPANPIVIGTSAIYTPPRVFGTAVAAS